VSRGIRAMMSVLQYVAVSCGVLQLVAVRFSEQGITCNYFCVTVCCSVLRYVAVYCSVLRRVGRCCSVSQRVAVCCSAL